MSRKTMKMVAYERLKAGDSYSEVRKELGSGKAFYEGLGMYMDEAEPRVGSCRQR